MTVHFWDNRQRVSTVGTKTTSRFAAKCAAIRYATHTPLIVHFHGSPL